MNCPGCGRLVSSMWSYIFIPSENTRWHPGCYRSATYRKEFNEKGERQ